MPPSKPGAFRLFRLAGIDVFLHWSWFVVALYEVQGGRGHYHSPVWNVLEYLTLFLIVTVHEFGHSLACRQSGGTANQVLLWPLGGLAYVNPPQRPGATLWSTAAGPLVNVILIPIIVCLALLIRYLGLQIVIPDLGVFVRAVAEMNLVLLIFNLLPVYPLDGGQILRSLLWFALGRARSLTVATLVGFLGVLGLVALAVLGNYPIGVRLWIGIIAAFMALNCWRGFQRARVLARLAALPRREGFACPSCGSAPPIGTFWACAQCHKQFDTFETHAVCPYCGAQFAQTSCADCGIQSPLSGWAAATVPAQRLQT
ncbi:MAG TPA: site-2 protease family protein [Vicinamibacteria bacterium]|jgi:Zn-dependent protease|nr:site-2 protease family protein [Vicinamibacteria bacterium]